MANYLEKVFNLEGKVAVITGGLGVLGTEYVKALVQSGAKAAVLDIKEPDAGHELAKLAKDFPIRFFKADITKRADLESALSQIEKEWDAPSVLINNAALDFPPAAGRKDDFENYPLDKWNTVLATNITGTFLCCQVIGGRMAEKGRGSVINISSIYGVVSPDQRIYNDFVKPAAYGATKSAVLNLTRYLATYWAKKGVRVNTLTPGGVFNNQDAEFVRKYGDRTPLGRMARKDEYNGAILFLASDASSYMTGANLVVDGGWTAW